MLYLAVPSPVCALVILALTQTVNPIWRRALILSVSALETCTVPSTEWMWTGIYWMNVFPSSSTWWTVFISSSHFCRWTQWKQGLVTSLSWDASLGLEALGTVLCGWDPDVPSALCGPLGRFPPHTHLTNLFCSQSLIDLPLSFLRAGTGSCSFLLYLSQSKQFFCHPRLF